MSNKFFKDLKKSLEEVVAYKQGKLNLYSEYIEIPKSPAMTKNKHLGSSFDDFLREQSILEEVELTAIEMVIAEKTLGRKTFQRYLKERFNENEIAEIKKQALQEYNALKAQEQK